ncbi:Uncharacterised protein [Legionella lansingensis]|uniref:Secreted protein n=1 Tax=Legionella lansingensis TaxID=45067 RepID=A0A0W0VG80_9GAMM|nr:hypothetical protein [Legionella lansingensis]KTD19136.1 hypothetical protein Llan_2207 [Legionella lansingensis]SNV45557.1 Uncharacterised protein [Legionella lansingensis]
MIKSLLSALVIFILSIITVHADNFVACKSKYALCTTAPCTPMAGKENIVSCHCDVKEGYSAATQPCQPAKQTKDGELIYSRYFPIKSYIKCSNGLGHGVLINLV